MRTPCQLLMYRIIFHVDLSAGTLPITRQNRALTVTCKKKRKDRLSGAFMGPKILNSS